MSPHSTKFSELVLLACLSVSLATAANAADSSPATADTSGSQPKAERAAQSSESGAAQDKKLPVSSVKEGGQSSATSSVKKTAAACPRKSTASPSKKCKSKSLDTPPCLTWIDAEADADPKAVILCVHGLGLHNGTYKDFGERMSKMGYAVYAMDVRGFGSYMAAKDRGRQKVNFDDCLEDVHKTLRTIHKVHPGLPVFLLGESMGGGIALRATSMYPDLIDGLISSVPAGDRFHQGKTTLMVAFKLLTAPNKEFDVGTGVINQATEKSNLKEMWSQDKFARLNLSAKELLQFQSFMNENHHSVKLIKTTPVLMVQGCNDKLVKPKGTMQLYDNIVCKDKELLMVENAEHLIFEEGQFNDQVIQKVDKWVTAHLTKQSGDHISSK